MLNLVIFFFIVLLLAAVGYAILHSHSVASKLETAQADLNEVTQTADEALTTAKVVEAKVEKSV